MAPQLRRLEEEVGHDAEVAEVMLPRQSSTKQPTYGALLRVRQFKDTARPLDLPTLTEAECSFTFEALLQSGVSGIFEKASIYYEGKLSTIPGNTKLKPKHDSMCNELKDI